MTVQIFFNRYTILKSDKFYYEDKIKINNISSRLVIKSIHYKKLYFFLVQIIN